METPRGSELRLNPPAAVENPHAGEGAVLLDIGGDVGALVVTMPSQTVGLEVEIRPSGARTAPSHQHFPHVAVVPRPLANGVAATLVYPEVHEGEYELVPLAGGSPALGVAALAVAVVGGAVTRETWPT
jgi:hypothetical protein